MIDGSIEGKEVAKDDAFQEAMTDVDFLRGAMREEMNGNKKSAYSQFFTPTPLAQFMSSLFTIQGSEIHILDAGAGVGSLFTAAVTHFCQSAHPPQRIHVTAYEIDDTLIEHLNGAKYRCEKMCHDHGIDFRATIKHEDFIESSVAYLRQKATLFSLDENEDDIENMRFDCVILTPLIKK